MPQTIHAVISSVKWPFGPISRISPWPVAPAGARFLEVVCRIYIEQLTSSPADQPDGLWTQNSSQPLERKRRFYQLALHDRQCRAAKQKQREPHSPIRFNK